MGKQRLNGVAPTEVGTDQVSSTEMLDKINPPGGKHNASTLLDEINSSIAKDKRTGGRADKFNQGPGQSQQDWEKRATDNLLTGYDFNYEHVAQAFLEQDNRQLQAERQTTWEKAKRGLVRTIGETAINILEIPGAVGGAITAAVTGDITDATHNWYMNFFEAGKNAMIEDQAIYKSKYGEEDGVMGTMLSADWLATEGASGLAFFASALAPGLGVAKLSKFTKLATRVGKSGKYGEMAVKAADKVSRKLGIADDTTKFAKIGQAAGQGMEVVAATTLNTVFEATVEARGAVDRYKQSLTQRYASTNMSIEDKVSLDEKVKNQASKVFKANVALLSIPNAIMNKSILGAGSSSWKKITSKVGVDNAGKIGRKAAFQKAAAEKAGKLGRYKALQAAKKVGAVGKHAGGNLMREGVIEEMGQMTIENYFTDGYLDEQIYNIREKDIYETYADVFGSKEGQIAALFGGILGSSATAFGAASSHKKINRSADDLIADMTNSMNLYTAARQDFYKTDDNGNYILDENDAMIVDQDKVGHVADAYATTEKFNKLAEHYRENGEIEKAEIIEAKLQAQAFRPFIAKGEEGFSALHDAIVNNPVTAEFVKTQNEKNGTSQSVEQYAALQVAKARLLEGDYVAYKQQVEKQLSYKDIEALGAKTNEEIAFAEEQREIFNDINLGNYLDNSAAARQRQVQKDKHVRHRNMLNEEFQGELQAAVTTDDKILKNIDNTLKELTDPAKQEANWKRFYNNKLKAKKFNEDGGTEYLSTLITNLDKATTLVEVQAIITAAEAEGLFLSDVKSEKLPTRVAEMAASDNVREMVAALRIYENHRDPNVESDYYSLASETRKALDKHVNRLNDVITAYYENKDDLEALKVENIEKYEKRRAVFDEISAQIATLNTELNTPKQKGVGDKITYRENYVRLASIRKKLVKEASQAQKDIDSLLTNIDTIQKRIDGMAIMKNIVEKINTEKKVDINTLLEYTVIMEDIGGRAKAALPAGEELAEYFVYNTRLTELTLQKQTLEAYAGMVNSTLEDVKKAIKKYQKYVQTKETKEILEYLQALDQVIENTDITVARLDTLQEDFEKTMGLAQAGALHIVNAYVAITQLVDDLYNGRELQLEELTPFIANDTPPPTQPPKAPKPPKPTKPTKPTNKFIPAIDKTAGKGFAKINKEHTAKFFRDIVFAEDEAVLLNFVDKQTSKNEQGEYIPIEKIAFYLETLLIYHPYLMNNASIKALYESADIIPGKNAYTADAKDFIEAFEQDVNDSTPKEKEKFRELENKVNELDAIIDADVAVNVSGKENSKIWSKAAPLVESIKKVAKLWEKSPIKEELTTLLQRVYSSYSGYKDKILANKKKTTTPDGPNKGIINTIKGSDALIAHVASIVNSTKDRVAVKALEEDAEAEGALWNTAEAKAEGVTVGNKVYWEDDNGNEFDGEVTLLLKSTSSGANALVRTEDKKLHLISTIQLEKSKWTPKRLNRKDGKDWKLTKDKETGQMVIGHKGEFTAMRVLSPINQVYIDYLEDPRDKTNDKIIFQFAPSKLAKSEDENERRALSIIKKVQRGTEISENERDHLIDWAPITLRITGAKNNNFVGAPIADKSFGDSNELWYIDKSVRADIIGKWLTAGGTVSGTQNNILDNISATFATQAPASLNQKANTNTKLTDVKHIQRKGMEVFAIQNDDMGVTVAYNNKGEKVTDLPGTISKNKGLVYLKTKTNRGDTFYLALQQTRMKDFNGGKELDLLSKIIYQVVKDGAKMDAPLRGDLLAYAKERTPELIVLFGEKNITYGDIYNTLVVSGKKHNQLSMSITNSVLTIGDTNWTADTISEETVRAIVGKKYVRTGFTGSGLKVKNGAYLSYLIDQKAITTATPAGEALFAPIENGNYALGAEMYLKPDGITIDTLRPKTKTAKDTKGIQEKLSSRAKSWLMRTKTFSADELKKLPNSSIIELNAMAKTKKGPKTDARLAQIKETTKNCG